MPEGAVVHYYNVVTGRIACERKVAPEIRRTVFLDDTTCPTCLQAARQNVDKEAPKTGSPFPHS